MEINHDIFEDRVDYENLARQLIRKFRGEQSQKQMNTLLGYNFNQWHKWESGQKKLKWSEFLDLSEKLDDGVFSTISSISNIPSGELKARQNSVLLYLRNKFGNLSDKKLSFYLDIDINKVRRILYENQDFEFSLFLKFLGKCTRLLPYFLESLKSNELTSNSKDTINKFLNQRQLEATYPWLSAIEAFLELREYKQLDSHSHQLIADRLNLPIKTVEFSLQLLEENNVIEKQKGKYQLNLKRVDMESATKVESASLAKYWTDKAVERFSTIDGVPSSGAGWSYRIFPVSKVAREEIRQKISKLYGEIHQILTEDGSRDKEFVQIYLLHYFDTDEFTYPNLKK
ncbi:MAG: DUF4423 domain-containing protein [Bdellovibrionales bacterium]|nr:DUF4423 domain-containing protein [Bdellovibrionales bacterium]